MVKYLTYMKGRQTTFQDGGMKCLQIFMFDSDFCLQQVQILKFDVSVENFQLRKSTSSNLKKMTFTSGKITFTFSMLVQSAGTGPPGLAHKLTHWLGHLPSLATLLYKFYFNQALLSGAIAVACYCVGLLFP